MDTMNIDLEEQHIYEPLKAYKLRYKDEHNRNTEQYFEDLRLKSEVNVEQNRVTVALINKLIKQRNDVSKRLRTRKGLRGFLIFLAIVSAILLAFGIYLATQGPVEGFSLFALIFGPLALIGSIVLIVVVLNPKIKLLNAEYGKLVAKINEQQGIAWGQMAPLNALFRYGMNVELFKKTLPLINLDQMFDSKRLDYLVNKFGLGDVEDINSSTLYVQSGDLNGNPFYICRELNHRLGTKTYSGSITITWTTTSYVNGKMQTTTHSQVLTATVEKPCPYYRELPYLVYGNEAAPRLSFSRSDSDAENMSQKQIDKEVNKKIKKIKKKAEKGTEKGDTFTVLGNEEFEVLWGATNRDNEVEFRLLFTPLAQKQLLELMKDKDVAFGDDFSFVKRKMINIIYPRHLINTSLEGNPDQFKFYDYEMIKKTFIDYNNSYFQHVFFTFAPVLSIPLYQQHKPHEYIYKDLYDSYVSFYEHEQVANRMNASAFAHPLSATPNILKTSVVSSGNFADSVKVTAYGYQTFARTDYISKLGNDGRMHTIPVHWTEYVPVEQTSDLVVQVLQPESELTPAEQVKKFFEQVNDRQVPPEQLVRVGMLVAYLAKKHDEQ